MPSDIHSMMKQINHLLKADEIKSEISDSDKVMEKSIPDGNIGPLLDELQLRLYHQWEGFLSKQPLKEIRNFANRLREMGNANHIDLLSVYGNALISSLDEFNIETLRERLTRFPGILNQLKN